MSISSPPPLLSRTLIYYPIKCKCKFKRGTLTINSVELSPQSKDDWGHILGLSSKAWNKLFIYPLETPQSCSPRRFDELNYNLTYHTSMLGYMYLVAIKQHDLYPIGTLKYDLVRVIINGTFYKQTMWRDHWKPANLFSCEVNKSRVYIRPHITQHYPNYKYQ